MPQALLQAATPVPFRGQAGSFALAPSKVWSVPELDYALLCDYVRTEAGIAHVIAAGVDTISKDEVPAAQNLGLLMRFGFAHAECGRPHRIEVIFQDEDGDRLAHLQAVIEPEWSPELPANWRQGAMSGLNLGVVLPRFGLYSFEVMINDTLVKSLPLRVAQRAAPEESGEST